MCLASTAYSTADEPVSPLYNRDIRPILADKCFRCHGPDKAARQANLRLDQRDDATRSRDGNQVIAPGKPANSELIRRITTTDRDEQMPPLDSGLSLSRREIETLRRWIASGAKYEQHWAFLRPHRPKLPAVKNKTWPQNAIDHFVLARLESEGLKPSVRADDAKLLRRVTLDLTGLPPTIEELDRYEATCKIDPEQAYVQYVDRLLASPRFGEHMAVGWLDAARYADTNGYFTDNDRTMWPWRDWVIRAFNSNMPFDRFTIEQLAGDLLPNATINQRIATGFNRNHMVNNETGIIEEEFRVEYVVDRVDTTSTVWMGLTLRCARCHDHKYDPISQKEFYRFFSFFNNVPERGLSGSGGNSTPILNVPDDGLNRQLKKVTAEIGETEKRFAAAKGQLEASQAKWEKTALQDFPKPRRDGLVAHFPLDGRIADQHKVGAVDSVPGMLGNAAKFVGGSCLQFKSARQFERDTAFSFGAWIQPSGTGCIISKTDDANDVRGFDVTLRKGKAVVSFVHRLNRNAIQVTTTSSIPYGQWHHLMVTYDGSSRAGGVRVYLDGKRQSVIVNQDTLSSSIHNNQPIRIGRKQASNSFRGLIDDVRLYSKQLSEKEVRDLAAYQLISGILERPPSNRTAAQKKRLRAWFLEHHAGNRLASLSKKLDQLRATQQRLVKSMPTTMVMQDTKKRRDAFVLVRGQYDQHGQKVTVGFPSVLSNKETKAAKPESNRIALAKWLVDPSHPLTARVTVNRLWQQAFGTGIVKTVDDFGTQGEWPSHPELLDWLAMELIDSGWDIKHILKRIVTSATYQQSSNVSPTLLDRDRHNRLLARGPRFRMRAETLRDNALAVSGLLVEQLGGPSVKPYQPKGLWEDVTYDSNMAYQQSHGASLYRRSLYSFWKRQSPPPNMLVFDAPTRETCTVERSRTNTPLQALVLMNDPTFVEAARKLAERVILDGGMSPQQRTIFVFRTVIARRPTTEEQRILLDIFQQQHTDFRRIPGNATKLLSVGESAVDESLDTVELATWTAVSNLLLSLDEVITKN